MTDMIHGPRPLSANEPMLPKWWRTVDLFTISLIFVLFAVGIILLMASSPTLAQDNSLQTFHYVKRQLAYAFVGFGALFSISIFATPKILYRWATILFVFGLGSLFLLPIFGTDQGKDAVRWYSLGYVNVQPSEFIKPVFVLFTAWLFSLHDKRGAPPVVGISFCFMLVLAVTLALQPDYGQAFLILSAWTIMYFTLGRSVGFLVVFAALTVVVGMVVYQHDSHFAGRIDGFLWDKVDPTEQIGFALRAIQEGGILGVGMGEGHIKGRLADSHTDFIIAVAAEEFGVLSVLGILGLYMLIGVRSAWRLLKERDVFIQIAGFGLLSIFMLQALVNLSVAARLVPTKGMTLPLISFGGSSFVAICVTLGALLALTRIRFDEK